MAPDPVEHRGDDFCAVGFVEYFVPCAGIGDHGEPGLAIALFERVEQCQFAVDGVEFARGRAAGQFVPGWWRCLRGRKRQRRLTDVDEIVLSLYAKGMTTGESAP